MTAITLNLLAEEQLAEQAQARDPFRITLFASISVVLLCAMAGAWVTYAAQKKQAELGALQAKRDSLSTSPSTTSGDTKSLKGVADDLLSIHQNRTLYARQLALLKDLVPATIQLVRMNFSLSIDSPESAGSGDGPSDSGSEGAAKAMRHKPKNLQHLSLQIDGKAISNRPEIEVDQFIKILRTDPVFSSQVKDIKLRSIARAAAPSDGTTTQPSASFVIECQYKERR